MTHFTVLVVGDDVEGTLAPYDENIQVKPYIHQTAEEVLAEFNKFRDKCLKKQQDGETLDPFQITTINLDKPTPEWWKQWSGGYLDAEGNALSTYNPKSKWDWYSVGGRWTGMFILKPGKTGELGRPGVFNNKPQYDADIVSVGDVDWKAMNAKARERAGNDWDALFKPYDAKGCMWKPEYVESQKKLHLEMYGTREEYIRRRGFWTTYALVTKDEWIAPGEMGYWGMSSDDTKDRDAFDTKFVTTLKSLPPETRLTLVDCHI